MSIFKEISNTVKNIFNADDDMIFDNDEEFATEKASQGKPAFSFGKKKQEESNAAFKLERPVFNASSHDFNVSQNGGNVRRQRSNGRIQVYVPKSFEEAFNIIKDVKSGFTAMVNVEVANPQVSQRIVDLISGAIYALDGECKKMGEKQYIFSLSTETVGAMDYLPVNGVKTEDPNSRFNFNMGQPFDFFNQQQGMGNQMQQPMQGGFSFGQQQVNFNQQPQQQVQQSQGYVPPTFSPQPPMSQF